MKFLANTNFFWLAIFVGLLSLTSCDNSNSDPKDEPCNPSFDQAAFFTFVADDIIIPSYENLNTATTELELAKNEFITLSNANNLTSLRDKFEIAYVAWQKSAQFEFGPAKAVFLRNSLNNFPLSEDEVLENIQSGVYNFDMPDNYDKGFPALDFLLYGIADNDADIINQYILGSNAEKYKAYLNDVVNDIKERVLTTLSDWNGEYRNTFINNKGTAAGTSLSLIINGFNENYELIKREKLGVPSGALTLGIPNVDRVEAFHSGLSTELLKAALNASVDLFKGKGFNGNVSGASLADYLDAANATKNDADLSTIITSQFDNILNALNKIESSLSVSIETDKAPVMDLYNEINRQLVNIKTDMPSLLCVSITYIDNPSDSD